MLTFDDAYADTAEYALPLLARYGFKAAIFVVTGYVGKTNEWDQNIGSAPLQLMSAGQICFWAAEGMEFGSHSRSHTDLTQLDERTLTDEVAASSTDLKELLGDAALSFTYPYGAYNVAVRDCVARTFPLAFTTHHGLNELTTEPNSLHRTMVLSYDSALDFIMRVRCGWSISERLLSRARQTVQRFRPYR
jgi:peptidoglycan/xylan/chitin deacetylase (PgdA/CDA1 family)